MIDELNVIKIYGGEDNKECLELRANFNAFKKLQKATGNVFTAMSDFANDVDARINSLPIFIQAMTDVDISLNDIEEKYLGLSYVKVMQTCSIIEKVLLSELMSEIKIEEKKEITPTTKVKEE